MDEHARDVLKDRFYEGEAAVASNAYYSYCYALDVIKGRFLAGEEVIVNSVVWLDSYVQDIIIPLIPNPNFDPKILPIKMQKELIEQLKYGWLWVVDFLKARC